MPNTFQVKYFADVNLADPFFDSLKADYPEFETWFKGKAEKGNSALAYLDGDRIAAFIYLKEENEEIVLQEMTIPAMQRVKIGTLKLDESIRNRRLGEGALGFCLWQWRNSGQQQIYVTVYEKQEALISLLSKFGFSLVGHKENGECVYMKDKTMLDDADVHGSFPFLQSSFSYGGIIPIEAQFHDRLFPYSELKNVRFDENAIEDVAGNGVTKVYIATPAGSTPFYEGEPVFFYRKATENKKYRSVITSFGRIVRITQVRSPERPLIPRDEFLKTVGNKSIFDTETLNRLYALRKNVVVLEVVYCGFFGAGNNVNFATLQANGLFPDYPYQIKYTPDQFKQILEMGGVNVQTTFID